MRLLLTATAALLAGAAAPALAQSTTVTVDALANSTTGGTSVAVTGLTAGQTYHIYQNTYDLWASGALPRYSDGNGITSRFAVAGDDSGQAPGTQIGTDSFGTYTQGGLTARYGSLVDTTVPGAFQFVGGNTLYTVKSSGALNLGYFDSNNGDNLGSITFKITAVPEPTSWALMIVGFGAVGAGLRSRRRATAAFA